MIRPGRRHGPRQRGGAAVTLAPDRPPVCDTCCFSVSAEPSPVLCSGRWVLGSVSATGLIAVEWVLAKGTRGWGLPGLCVSWEEAGRPGTPGGLQGLGGIRGCPVRSVWRAAGGPVLPRHSQGSGWGRGPSRHPPKGAPLPLHSQSAPMSCSRWAGLASLFVIGHRSLFLDGHHELTVWPRARALSLLSCGLPVD